MNREKAIKILRKISPFILPAPRDRDAIRFAIDFMENHQKPTEQDTAHEPIMTDRENKIYNMVHTWCDEQAQDIPDQNRRYLMDAIVGMIDPQQDEPSNNLEVANTDLKKAIELTREIKDREGYNSFHGLEFFELNANEREALKTVIEAAEKSLKESEDVQCNNCGVSKTQKTEDGHWCKMCHNEM